jgi:hypothetical protein
MKIQNALSPQNATVLQRKNMLFYYPKVFCKIFGFFSDFFVIIKMASLPGLSDLDSPFYQG